MARYRLWPLRLGVLLLLAACGGENGGDLRVIVAGAPDDTDDARAALVTEATEATLIGRNAQGAAIPDLASSWRFVDDGRTLILRLKPIKWSDGKPLVAADVVASLRRSIANSGADDRAAGLFPIDGAEAVGAGTAPMSRLGVLAPTTRVVEIRMTAPMPALLDWLTQPEFSITRSAKGGAAPSLGSYRAAPGEPRVLTRTSETSRDDAQPARITIARADPSAAIDAFAAAKVDVVTGAGLEGIERLQGEPNAAARIEQVWGVYGWQANTRFGPLADLRIRRALAMTVDRDGIAARFGTIGLAPLTTLLPPSLAPGDPVQPDWAALDAPARRAQAEQLLAAAGFGQTRALHLTLLLPRGAVHATIAAAAARSWAQLGIIVSTEAVDPKAFAARVARGNFDLAVDERIAPADDRSFLLTGLACAPPVYCNPAARDLVRAARSLPSAEAAAALLRAETLITADVAVIPLFIPVRWTLVARTVAGWSPNLAAAHPLGRIATKSARSP